MPYKFNSYSSSKIKSEKRSLLNAVAFSHDIKSNTYEHLDNPKEL
ncbi:MAG: hypothetical protein Q7S59_01505 [Sulfurimonas sp.]|nr:hypothetical protein [Sulfurimonas sp.]